MIAPALKIHLDRLAAKHRALHFSKRLLTIWILFAAAGGLVLLLQATTRYRFPIALPLLGLGAMGAFAALWWKASRAKTDYRALARQIEVNDPRLKTALLAAVEQEPVSPTGEFSYLQERVILEALEHNRRSPWDQKMTQKVFLTRCASLGAFAALVLIFGILVATTPRTSPLALVVDSISVSPGDTSLEKGSPLVVLAKFPRPLPPDVTLVAQNSLGETRRINLAKSLSDPVFGGTLSDANVDFSYYLEYGGSRTRKYNVEVFEYPNLERADASLAYPSYTELQPREIPDTMRVSGVEGTRLAYKLRLNKAVASAKLKAKDNTLVPIAQDKQSPNVFSASMVLEKSQKYELQLVDEQGRTNKMPIEFIVEVQTNNAPQLKLAAPRGDQRLSPLEEVAIAAEAADDFGLKAYGVAYAVGDGEPKYIELGKTAPRMEKQQFKNLLRLEEHSVKPDDLVSYFVWADDLGPDGSVRRSAGDIYFAEIRPFEEIFREAQGGGGGGGGQQQGQQQGQELTDLMKQIMSGTWNLQRRENRAKPSENFKKDVEVLHESQEEAIAQADALVERTEDPKSRQFAEKAREEMEKSLAQLGEAGKKNAAAPLGAAHKAQRAAFQELLKLASRNFQVSRSRNQQGGGGGGGQQQRQLDQLEMKQEEDRYETQSQAAALQTPEDRERLKFQSRLKELAQRQNDINERLKELQTALQEAKTEQEKEELRRQLKRLQEEQRSMLADLDELRQRANRPEASEMAEALKQMEQTRSEVQQAAEQLEQGSAAQALSAGTRAQRNLQQMRDELRNQSSSQFAEAMQNMRSQARDLSQKQEEISKKLTDMQQSERKTLADSEERAQISEQLQEQNLGMTNLLSNMRQVTEQAETSEPLLSRQLYDSIRRTDPSKAGNALNAGAEFVRRGFVPQAADASKTAQTTIDNLKKDVERAAESVLGNENEALRLAKNELDELTRQLEREMNANGGGGNGTNANSRAGGQQGRQTAGNRGTNSTNRAFGPGGEQGTNSLGGFARNGSTNENGLASSQQGRGSRAGNRGERNGEQAQAQAQGGRQPGGQSQPGDQNGQGEPGENGQGESESQNETAQASNGRQGQQGQQGQGQRGGQGQQGQPGGRGQQGQQASNSQGQEGQEGQGEGQGEGQQIGQRGGRGNGQGQGQNAEQAQGRGGEGRGGNFFDDQRGGGGTGGGSAGPLTGREFTQWAERLRDVEELVESPDLRTQVAQAREQARNTRAEYTRHSKDPQWPMVNLQILKPLLEVRDRLAEELARRETPDSLLPIDRDPVPRQYSELVRRYYEKLGSSEQ